MPIISVWDNENNRWKRNEKKTKKKQTNREKYKKKDRKEQGGTEAIVKQWELNDFFVQVRFPPINM